MTTTTTSIHLGPLYAGLTLAAQLIDTTGTPVGDPITSGFVEIGNGDYLWTADTSAVTQGGVKIYAVGAPGTVLAVGALQVAAANVTMSAGVALTNRLAQVDDLPVSAGSGTGTYSDTITDGTNPLDGARVQLATDAAGIHRVYEAFTNALGVFVMYPDPGVYYRWIDLAGYSDNDQGLEVTVS